MISTSAAAVAARGLGETLSQSLHSRVFPAHLETVPQLNELYELELVSRPT